jgi:hypothetical protein
MGIGFTADISDKKGRAYDDFIGKPGHYGVGSITATGVLKEVNFDKGYLVVQPSLVGYGDAGEVRLNKDSPTIVGMVHGAPIVMRPLEEGDLESMVKKKKKPSKNSKE